MISKYWVGKIRVEKFFLGGYTTFDNPFSGYVTLCDGESDRIKNALMVDYSYTPIVIHKLGKAVKFKNRKTFYLMMIDKTLLSC